MEIEDLYVVSSEDDIPLLIDAGYTALADMDRVICLDKCDDPERIAHNLNIIQPKYITNYARAKDKDRWSGIAAFMTCEFGYYWIDHFSSTNAMVAEFKSRIKGKRYAPIATGIRPLDEVLDGGFMAQQLVSLGAPPAMGKTTLAMWIMENIAKAGRKAIYINLEMSRDQMLAKAISRRAMEDDIGPISVSPLEVLRYYSLDKNKADGVDKALEKWMEEAGKNIIYNPDGVTNSLDRIMGYLDMVAAESKGPKPIICIDYLHLIDAGKDAMEGIKDATKRLKDYAVRNDTVVIIIIANGRLANKSGKSSMSDGRDSSAIEYTGDVMLSLSFWLRECGKAENEIVYSALASRSQNEFMAMMPSVNNGPEVWEHRNHIVLKVTKNRWGSFGQCELRSDGRHSRFTEWGTDANIRAMTNEERITQERLFPNKKSNRF